MVPATRLEVIERSVVGWLTVRPRTVGARAVLQEGGTGRFLATAPVVCVDDEAQVSGYEHPLRMERLVRARDRTCRAPGCLRLARRGDCDHLVPWPQGPTSVANACCLCRYHHRLRAHAPGWVVTAAERGAVAWATRTGAVRRTEPYDYAEPEDGASGAEGLDQPPF